MHWLEEGCLVTTVLKVWLIVGPAAHQVAIGQQADSLFHCSTVQPALQADAPGGIVSTAGWVLLPQLQELLLHR